MSKNLIVEIKHNSVNLSVDNIADIFNFDMHDIYHVISKAELDVWFNDLDGRRQRMLSLPDAMQLIYLLGYQRGQDNLILEIEQERWANDVD